MRRSLFVIAVLGALLAVKASATTVTGTVTDSDNIAWANGSITFNLVGNGGPYSCAGTAMTPSQTTVTMTLDSTGSFSGTLCDNTTITPVSSQWAIQISSAATSPAQTIASTTVSGSSQSLSSYINGLIKVIRLAPVYGTIAYSDIEILSPSNGFIYFNLTSLTNRVWNGSSWSNINSGITPITPSNTYLYCNAAGMKCDGVTDDTTAFQNLLNSVATVGGGWIQGTCGKTSLILGQITTKASLTTPWAMPPIHISGCGASIGGSADNPTIGAPGAPFTLDMRFTGSRIISLGQGTLEIDHLNIVNGGTNCGAFFQTTLTNLKLHDNAIFGSILNGGSTNACDDVWIAGGTNGTNLGLNGSINDYFQGYGSVVRDNFADYIRSFVTGRVAFNSIPIVDNTIWSHSGSNSTTAITAATNANPVVLTSTAHNFPTASGGPSMALTFAGYTGNWTSLNGVHTITVINTNTFSVAIDSTGFGSLTGTPAYLSGAAFSIDGTAASGSNFTDSGNDLTGNLVEQNHYPFVYQFGVAGGNRISGTSCWDSTTVSIACVWQQVATTANNIQLNHSSTLGVLSSNAFNANGSLVINNTQVQSYLTLYPQVTGTITFPYAIDANLLTGSQLVMSLEMDGSNFDGGSIFFKNVGGTGSSSNLVGLFIPGGSAMTIDGTGKVTDPSLVVAGTTKLATPATFPWSALGIVLNGTVNSGKQNTWTPTNANTAVQIEYNITSQPVGCSTFPAVGLIDTSNSNAVVCAITVPNGTFGNHASCSTAAMTAGHTFAFGITTAASGCSLNTGTAYVSLSAYQATN